MLMAKLLWEPTESYQEQSNIIAFIKFINTKLNQNITNYDELYNFSISNIENFWNSVWEYSEIIHSNSFDKVVDNLEAFPPATKWFTGSKLNFAENLLRYRDEVNAFVFKNETQPIRSITYKELYIKVGQLASSLKKLGISHGDRIVGYMPNIPETVIAMLAATSLGATWSSCGSELGSDAALDRLGQVQPVVLFTVDAYTYKEDKFDMIDKVKPLIEKIESLKQVVVFEYINQKLTSKDLHDHQNTINWNEFIDKSFTAQDDIDFVQVDFNHPLYIMFSSGTTGKPKCIVQSVGGILINHLKELIIHTDLKRSDTILYLTSPSWMMWNWVTSSLSVGATIFVFDGNPLHPSWETIFKIIQDYKISIFGCSASYLHHLKNIEANPGEKFNLSSLREISQTGSTLSEEGFIFVYEKIKSDLHFNGISGGTDINGCFAAGAPILPVYLGQVQARALGMKVVAYDDEMNHVYDQQGELICELPAPSMPIYFWGDSDHQKYNDAYFNYYDTKRVWRHGDYIEISTITGGVMFYGRSDAVLKPSGVRIGTAEIYNIVEEFEEIADSLAIGYNRKNDQEILLFVQFNPGYSLNDEITQKIKKELRSKASPRHVPAKLFEVADIPYTFSGKKVESAVTNIVNGRKVTNRNALRNPESLDIYESIKLNL
jgi:acetoacetyl-CoA synthetase